MNSAYSVGASFTLENLFSPEVAKIAGDLTKLDVKIEETKKRMQGLVPANLSKRIEAVAGSFDLLGPSADAASSAMIGAMSRAEAGVMRAATGINGELDSAFADADVAADKAANGMIAAMRRAELASKGSADAIQLGFSGAFTGMDAGIGTAADNITKQFARITRSAGRSTTAIANMRREIEALSALSSAPMPQLPAGAGGMGGGRGGGRGGHRGGLGRSSNGFHFDNRESFNTPLGHVSGSGGAGAVLAGVAVAGDAIYEAAEVEDIVTKVLMTSGITPGKHALTDTAEGRKLFTIIQGGAKKTGFSQHDVGDMILGTEREFQGLKFDQKMDTLAMLLPAMGNEAHLRHSDLKGAGENIVALMHMAGTFKPEDMPEIARAFQFTTMATPVELSQFKNALSYSLPTLHGALGMDPSTVMLLTSMMQTAGVGNSKSGTWLRQFFVDAEPSTDVLGPLTKSQKQHNEALYMLGLADDKGRQNWKVNGADGKTDWNSSVIAMANKLRAGIDSIPEGQRADVLHRAFGTQGSGMATLLEQQTFREQLPVLSDKMKMYKGGDWSLGEYAEGSTIQQARIAQQEFQTLMADLGTKLLPPINFALHGMTDALEKLPEDWEKTKKLWSDRFAWLQHPFGGSNGPDLGPAPAPSPDQGYLMGPGFSPMAYRTDEAGFGGESSGGVSSAEDVIYRGVLRAFTDFTSGKTAAGAAGGFMNASFGGGGFGGGGGGGGGGVDMGGSYGAAHVASGALAANQKEAYDAARASGLSENAARALVANMSGESLASPHDLHWDRKHMSGGIVQWDPQRANAIERQFGKLPWNMSVAEQTKAAIWEINTNPAYAETKAALANGGSAAGMIGTLVRNYERPADKAKAIGQRLGFLSGFDPNAVAGAAGGAAGSSGKDPLAIANALNGMGSAQAGQALGHIMHAGEWCADFVNGVIEKGGGKGSGSSMAQSFHTWGQHVGISDVQSGDVIVEDHGGHGHVGIATGAIKRDAAGNIVAIGMTSGNHGNRVRANYWESVGEIADLRRGASSVRAAPKQPDVHVVHTEVKLDGKQVGKSVAKIMGKSLRHPSSMGAPDGHSHYVSPGTPVMDSA